MGASSRTSHAPPHSNFLFVYRASYFSAPTVSLYSTPYLCLIFFFKTPGEVCQGCTELLRYEMRTCHWTFGMLLGLYCLLFSFSGQFSLRVRCIRISKASSDSLTIQSLRKQRGYIPHSTLNQRLIWRPAGKSAALPHIL